MPSTEAVPNLYGQESTSIRVAARAAVQAYLLTLDPEDIVHPDLWRHRLAGFLAVVAERNPAEAWFDGSAATFVSYAFDDLGVPADERDAALEMVASWECGVPAR